MKEEEKRGLSILKVFLKRFYYFSTAIIIILAFIISFYIDRDVKKSMFFTIGVFLLLDIICSMLEDFFVFSIKSVKKCKSKKKKKYAIYAESIKNVKKINSNLKEIIKKRDRNFSILVVKKIEEICNKMDSLLTLVEKKKKEPYQIRYLFEILYPEFFQITKDYLTEIGNDTLKEQDVEKYLFLIDKINKYIYFSESKLNIEEQTNLSKRIISLVKNIQVEMEKE